MGKFDKDRFQKELAVRYCLATNALPFIEVIASSTSDLSDTPEPLTDLDVVGIASLGDGELVRTFFDCKTAGKMSAINRAFWAAGVRQYVDFDRAVVILRNRAVINHRLSALTLNVDLHDEESFRQLGKTIDEAFPMDSCYQASLSRWEVLDNAYGDNTWSLKTQELVRNHVPLTSTPWTTFRHLMAELRDTRGQYDPAKPKHVAIFFEVLSATMVLWSTLVRDMRRFYEPGMDRAAFEKLLRFYLWGGKDAYNIRQQLRHRANPDSAEIADLPAWSDLVDFAGIAVGAPRSIFPCAFLMKELALRNVCGTDSAHDEAITDLIRSDSRLRQFSLQLASYLVKAGKLPSDITAEIESQLSWF